jgi:DNA repair protein RadC
MGDYEVVQRRADRRHGVLPVALLISSAAGSETLMQFDSVSEAKAWALSYEEMAPYVLRRARLGASEEASRAQPSTSIRVPLNVDMKGAHIDGTLKLDDGGFRPPRGVPLMPGGEPKSKEIARPKDEGGAAEQSGVRTISRHIRWERSPRGFAGIGYVTGSYYKVDVHGRGSNKRPVWTVMKNGIEDRGFFYDEQAAMVHADHLEARAGHLPDSAEVPAARPAGEFVAVETPTSPDRKLIDAPGTAPLVTLQRDFKKYVACSAAAKRVGSIDGAKQIWQLLGRTMLSEPQEVFIVVPLNIHDRLSSCPIEVARGAHARVEVDPAIVVQAALAANADSFIVVHNHPGSRPDPSDADIELTRAVEKAAAAAGGGGKDPSLRMKEHYVISEKGCYAVNARKMWKA